jgi:hypothetical protein
MHATRPTTHANLSPHPRSPPPPPPVSPSSAPNLSPTLSLQPHPQPNARPWPLPDQADFYYVKLARVEEACVAEAAPSALSQEVLRLLREEEADATLGAGED